MSPEQATGAAVDARTDVWSLGVILYEMLAGKLPFRGPHISAQIQAIIQAEPQPLRELRHDVPEDLERIVRRAMEKDAHRRYASAGELVQALSACQMSLLASDASRIAAGRERVRKRMAMAAVLVILAVATVGAIFVRRTLKARWAREQALPEIARLAGENKQMAAYRLALEAERYIPSDPELARLWQEVSTELNFETNPPGATVELQEYTDPAGKWMPVGLSPVEKVRVPKVYIRWRVSKPGFAVLVGAMPPRGRKHIVDLVPDGTIPAGMVRVAGLRSHYAYVNQLGALAPMPVEAFLIDKYEITNRQYKEFVDAGGYRRREFWKQPFFKDGRPVTWEEAMDLFRDARSTPTTRRI